MDNNERDQLIARLISEGNSLSDIQKILKDQHNIQMTYMELRLISSDLSVSWEKCDEKNSKQASRIIDKNAGDGLDDSAADTAGGTIINVSKVVRPGSVVSGDVRFKSGAKAEWHLDQLGRLGLNPKGDSEKPSEEDLREFQMELQKVLQGKM